MWFIRIILFFLVCATAFIILMAKPDRISYLAAVAELQTREIYVVKHGWHAGIVIPIDDIPENLIPEK